MTPHRGAFQPARMLSLLQCAAALLVPGFSTALAQSATDEIDAYLRHRTGAPYSGVVLIARGDSIVFERAYGTADADLAVPNTPELRFNIGSVTKPLTATAVLRLAQDGRLTIQEPVCKYLRRCPASWRGVSLRHLLSHTSGIPDLFRELPAAPAESLQVVVDAAISDHLSDTLRSPAGSQYQYSNFNYILLGYVLESAARLPWRVVLQREVFAPAGMGETEYDDVWRVLRGRVRGYALSGGELRHVRYRDHAAYTAGGILSTARDLLTFERALANGRLLPDSLFRTMTTPVLDNYGLGWQLVPAFGRTLRNHTGGTTGFASHLASYSDGTVIILLSNVEDEPAKATACDLAAMLFGVGPSDRTAGVAPCRAEP